MSHRKEYKRPQKSRFRENLARDKERSRQEAQELNKQHEGRVEEKRAIAPKTEYEQWRIWDAWLMYVEEIQKRDPRQLWIDLLDRRPVIQIFKSFWEQYVRSSTTLRPVLGPEEYEEVRGVNSAVSVLGFWKLLLAAADKTVMEEKRRLEPEKLHHYTTLISTNGLHGKGPLYAIAQWIEGDLADKLSLTRRQTFDKVEMASDDIIVVLITLWLRGTDIQCTPANRLAFHTVIVMSGIGGFRSGTLLGLRYRNVRLALVRDPCDSTKRRLVAHVKIEHNKQHTKKVKHDQADTLTFSVTLVPCQLLCLVSLLATRALADNAFEVDYKSLQDILEKPRMGDVDYVPLNWKEGFDEKEIIPLQYFKYKELWDQTLLVAGSRESQRPHSMRVGAGGRLDGALEPAVRSYVLSNSEDVFRDSYQPQHVREELSRIAFGETLMGRNDALFKLLGRSSLRRDENAPIYPTKEQLQQLEKRRDLTELRAEYERAVAANKGKSTNAEANRISGRIQWIRDSLSNLLVQQRRAEYFSTADRMRAQGQKVPDYARETCPFKTYEKPSGEASEKIGQFLALRLVNVPETGLDDRWAAAFSDMLLALLSRLHARVNLLGAQAIAELNNAQLPPTPAKSISRTPGPHKCLLCLETYARRGTLTKHNTRVHCKEDGILTRPFTCPECERKGIRHPATIDGPIQWSNHVEKCHGRENAPNLPSGLVKWMAKVRVPATDLVLAKHQERCLICEDVFEAGSGFSRHVTMIHEKTGFFDNPFDCPACKRAGTTVLVEDILVWRVHLLKVHSDGGRFGHLLVPKRKLDEMRDRDLDERAIRKKQRIERPDGNPISVPAL